MSMTHEQIRDFVMTYLEATECNILEKSPHHVTVKLSPRADRDLTNRPYYWGFIERTGAEPETMSFSFIFNPEQHHAAEKKAQAAATKNSEPASGEAQAEEDSILGRYFGGVRPLPILGPGRIQREELTFGSPRLGQIFEATRRGGRYVYLFEETAPRQRLSLLPAAYEPWLGVCFKVEFSCDMKREELHNYGISLLSGKLDESFQERLATKNLSPRLPENVHIEPTELTLDEGRQALEARISAKLESYDESWATAARERLNDELALIDAYYRDLLQDPDAERAAGAQEQYEARRSEIRWQYEPRIVVSALGCGIFHLRSPR
ncbi:YqhG family protein [Paenibacillus senegalimassiliensis]|uniref:YqhG family protein n=1 Tax=Paenibacillus senegalimassiliensis TaxID=1737426 RepID=UPI00073E42ED|nr:YqhG family protein [Paenibacillus senegalimassiliensis]